MAQNQMYNPTQAALYGPDLLARQLRLQQSQQFGQQMLEQGQQAPQGQMVSGHYVAPSITQYLSQGLKSYAGRKAMDDLPDQMAGIAQAQQEGTNRMFGIGQPSPQALATGLGGHSQGTPMQSPAGQPQMPLLPGRSAQESAKLFALMGPQEYMKQVATQGTPTDIQKNLIAQGVIPGSPEWNQALSGNVTKSNYIAPTSVAPGGTLIDPNTRQPVFNAPQNGIQTQYGPNGQATAAAVPGYAGANAGIQGAEAGAIAGAKAKFNLVSVPNGNGGTDLMPEDQAAERLRNTGGQGASQSPNQPTGDLGRTLSPQVIAARKDLPQVTTNIDTMIRTIDAALTSPGKKYAVGIGSLAPTIPNTEQANFRAVNDQLKGQVFLQAYQTLKGGGQITEVEGKKAENAIARLGTAQTVKAYDEALNELKGVLSNSRNRAYEQAGMSVPAAKEAPTAAAPKKPEFDRSALEAEARKRGLIK